MILPSVCSCLAPFDHGTTEKLRKHFMLFGEVIDAVVMKDPISRR